jgi:HPt (histidine-containing phosphotransfer) domain-containing protein
VNGFNTATLEKLLLLAQKNQAPLLNTLQTIIDSCPINITFLHQAFSKNNFEAAGQRLHQIRGSFATLGADQFAQQCAVVEQQLQLNTLPTEAERIALFTLYQDSCLALQSFIAPLVAVKKAPASNIDLHQLLQLLEQQNMAATALAHAGAEQLRQVLSAHDARDFFQQLAQLNYSTAAVLLRSHLAAKQYSQRKGD